jgi:RNA-directed DNA polymerase
MSSGSYFPPPVKAVTIPKKNGGQRILGVPTVTDRVAQMEVKRVLEPNLEPIFLPDSYWLPPGKVCAGRRGGHATAMLAVRLGSGIRH